MSNAGTAPIVLWFRRDLRLRDNLALTEACASGRPVICLYIRPEGDPLAGANGEAQAWWLHHSLASLSDDLAARGNRLVLRTGEPRQVIADIIGETGADTLLWNRRYDPQGIATDRQCKAEFRAAGLRVESFAGFLMHEPGKLLTREGKRYSVYTPFWRAFESQYQPLGLAPAPERIPAPGPTLASEELAAWQLLPQRPDWALAFGEIWTPGEAGAQRRLEWFLDHAIRGYKTARDTPSGQTTSLLAPHLAFGEMSPVRVWQASLELGETMPTEDVVHFRKEVVWREFSWHLLFHSPDLDSVNLNRRFDAFPWQTNPDHLARWQKGMTGYPIVDAGMRQLWKHGYMHNRVRMVAASFLIKDLLIDWRAGEAWFRDTLVDADRASNAASWQWVAGCGADAAPYFRIFNPVKQGETFDPQGHYVRRYCPELKDLPDRYIHRPFDAPPEVLGRANVVLGRTYPRPIVDHDQARKYALQSYEHIKSED